MKNKSLVSIDDLTTDEILKILDDAAEFEKNPVQDLLLGKVIATFCDHVIIKDGKKGALANWEGIEYQSDALQVKAIDTTGAGDCFNAGFIKAYLLKKPIQECLEWANIVGGLSTEGLGGVTRAVTQLDIDKRLKP